jgi:hypothetical protein
MRGFTTNASVQMAFVYAQFCLILSFLLILSKTSPKSQPLRYFGYHFPAIAGDERVQRLLVRDLAKSVN